MVFTAFILRAITDAIFYPMSFADICITKIVSELVILRVVTTVDF